MTVATSDLTTIQQKVRRLTRSPSESQLSEADLNQYINTFVIYDFPEHIRDYFLRTNFVFWSQPFVGTYPLDTARIPTDPLYDFKNLYITTHRPVYIGGYLALWSQSQEQFYGIYPLVNSISSIGPMGNGITLSYTGMLANTPMLQNNVLFSSVDVDYAPLSMVDVPVIDVVTGYPTQIGNLYPSNFQPLTPPTAVLPNNNINYQTGEYIVTFTTPPMAGTAINSQIVPYVASIPQAVLYYDNSFVLRPIPDQPYRIQMEVYKRPTEILGSNQNPELNQWWQYIAYGASIKILQDRLDMDTVALLQPEFNEQQRLCIRRTIVQQTNERTATIYTEQSMQNGNNGAWGWGGGSF